MSSAGKENKGGGAPHRIFGQSMKKSNKSAYQRQMGKRSKTVLTTSSDEEEKAQRAAEFKRQKKLDGIAHDESYGYSNWDYKTHKSQPRRGWVFNMLPTTVDVTSDTSSSEKAAVDLYCIDTDGLTFKCTVLHQPYFYVVPSDETSHLIQPIAYGDDDEDIDINAMEFNNMKMHLMRKYETLGLQGVEVVALQDLDQVNHLSPSCKGRSMFKLVFDTVQQLMDVRKEIQALVQENQQRRHNMSPSMLFLSNGPHHDSENNPLSTLIDIREYDVPYLVRACIDLNLRAGTWYTITPTDDHSCAFTDASATKRAEPTVLAFDIECTKAPLKFPDAKGGDEIFMISYMVNGKGYLIISRTVVGQDIEDFEYTPKPHFPGPFEIFNEKNEEALIRRFFTHYQELKPQIVVTYNGDFFDWPFLEDRAKVYNLDLEKHLGISEQSSGEYRGRTAVHLDAFHWVRRDSYLPQGSQGLKAVTKNKLGYDPVEVDPEDMVPYAIEQPVKMATYSVSDAVATFYLYQTYVHFFIFSLCTIIPMGPEDVLRKGSGTLCETLLMVEAFNKAIICPNKHVDPLERFHNGHLVESETYIGGKVECLETGVYRSDIKYEFNMVPAAFDRLIAKVDRDLTFAIEVEGGKKVQDIINYNDVKEKIINKLEELRDRPKRWEQPFVYHLDVGAMYPNIILTNRLQPSAIVDDAICAACDFNQEANKCKRVMEWVWRGDYNPATKSEYDQTKNQLIREFVDGKPFSELSLKEQANLASTRLKQYSKNAYKKTKVTQEETRKSTVCMRENDFYVATVLRFRDRRYELKKLTKDAKTDAKSAKNAVDRKEAEDRALIYDSLQVAHKCILNSFYGYVMRKGARWRSMEMAGIVTKTGADLITQARILVEQIGRPLELDTDGIWCILPKSFPDVYNFQVKGGGSLKLEYPCIMLNADVNANFSNHQYQTLDKETGIYTTRSECSIFFEVDGPYRCMVLPASTEEGKLLKKRYAVFNHDGSLAELKGFELKRRGELELIKAFQSQVFEHFLDGASLEDCYGSVAEIANHWMDVLDTQGESLDTEEIFDLISENRNMSRQLDDYGTQKGTSQTTARRLGEFLGAEIIKDKGLNCKFIIAERPHGAPVTERAIPTAIWKAESAVKKHFLKKWLKSPEIEDFDVRSIVDWDYYRERLAKTIQKIITIPAALQGVHNPVPRIPHPDWLHKTVARKSDRFQQKSLLQMFKSANKENDSKTENKNTKPADIEDILGGTTPNSKRPLVHSKKRLTSTISPETDTSSNEKTNAVVVTPLPRAKLSKDSFPEWLAQRKAQWRLARSDKRQVRKRLYHLNSADSAYHATDQSKRRKAVGSMAGFLEDAANDIREREWQIIEIRETSSGSGEFVAWIMVDNKSLQRIQLTVPRVIYVNCLKELPECFEDTEFKRIKVERFLPHGKTAVHLYEVIMSEHLFRSHTWQEKFLAGYEGNPLTVIEAVYESSSPLSFKLLVELGCVSKVSSATDKKKGRGEKSFALNQLSRVEKPSMEYLNANLSYRRIFLYDGVNPRSKTGIVALFMMEGGSGECGEVEIDLTRPESCSSKLKLDSRCYLWVVKPGASRGQKAITTKNCERIFDDLLSQILTLVHEDSLDGGGRYACLSPNSQCNFVRLNFVDGERKTFHEVNETLNQYLQEKRGPTFLLTNSSSKTSSLLRKYIPNSIEFPNIALPLPSGEHSRRLPSLNWEPLAVQLCLEAYFHMGAFSYPQRVRSARYGNIPVGNLGLDDSLTLYDVCLARQLRKARALLWSSISPGVSDLGCSIIEAGEIAAPSSEELCTSMWGSCDSLSTVVHNPGAYRTVCVEIDIHDLAIAALTDPNTSINDSIQHRNTVSSSLTGDELACSMAYQLIRSVSQAWLRDAYDRNNSVADDLLHHLYRIVCTPESLLYDPALYRLIRSTMISMFHRLLGELHYLGVKVVSATFRRIILATNKSNLDAVQEYISFVIATIKKRGGGQEGIGRITLNPSKYWSHLLFMDQYNMSGIQLQGREPETEDELQWAFAVQEQNYVPTFVCKWNIMNYLAGEIQQECFRALVSRFSRDVWRKEAIQLRKASSDAVCNNQEMEQGLVQYRKKLVSQHFAFDLTRMAGEMIKVGGGHDAFPILPGSHLHLGNPVLEFIKNVMQVLRLDSSVEKEVNALNRSLLSQIGVQEYDPSTKWKNPCADFVLPDVFCSECHECRDVNLCVLPNFEYDEKEYSWSCEDCGCPYGKDAIEWRLVSFIQSRIVQYQLQDLRCSKSQSVAKRNLSKQSDSSSPLNLDVPRDDVLLQLLTLRALSDFHDLEWLRETVQITLDSFKSDL